MFNNPILSYVGFGLGCVAIVLSVIEPDWGSVLWVVAGVLGFGSVAALRSFIDAKGIKTYAIFAVICVCSVLQIMNVISMELYQMLIVGFAPLTGITMQQALAKSSASVPKINGG